MFTAKTVIIDCLDSHGSLDYVGIRAIEFYKAGVLLPLTASDFVAYSSLGLSSYVAKNIFDTTLPTVGGSSENEWSSYTKCDTNQRVSCVFNDPIEFDEIRVHNSHNSGTYTTIGVKNARIYTRQDAYTSKIFGSGVADATRIFNGVIAEHPPTDTSTSSTLALEVSVPALYQAKTVIFDFADSYDFWYMGIRAIEFYKAGVLLPFTPSDFTAYHTRTNSTDYHASMVFDTTLSKIGDSKLTSWLEGSSYFDEKRIICVFNEVIEFDDIWVCPYHRYGVDTEYGVKSTWVHTSLDVVTDVMFGGSLDGATKIFDGVILQHSSDKYAIEMQALALTPAPEPIVIEVPAFRMPAKLYGLPDFVFVIQAGPFLAGAELQATPWDNVAWLNFREAHGDTAVKLYRCVVTGSADNLPDVSVPIRSFLARRRDGEPSYLQVVVPGSEFFEVIAQRSNGDIMILMSYWAFGELQYEEQIARVTLENISIYGGSRGQSVTLFGHKMELITSYKSQPVTGATRVSAAGDRFKLLLAVPDLYLNPRDVVTFGDLTLTTHSITTMVSVSDGGRPKSSTEIAGVING